MHCRHTSQGYGGGPVSDASESVVDRDAYIDADSALPVDVERESLHSTPGYTIASSSKSFFEKLPNAPPNIDPVHDDLRGVS